MRRALVAIFLLFIFIAHVIEVSARENLKPQDILKIPFTPTEHRFHYGKDKKQIGDLRVPDSKGSFPVVVIIHGGCWTTKMAALDFMSPFAEALTKRGVATWNIEYRGFDVVGGGWPGTFNDIGAAIDYLKVLAPKYNLDLKRVVVVGHSAGGHLALWSGARHKIKRDSVLYKANPFKAKAVVNLAGVGDLRKFMTIQENVCRDKVVNKLLGNEARKMDVRLKQASPYEMLPLRTKQLLITGEFDEAASVDSMQQYLRKAKKLGDDIRLNVLKDAAHFEVVDPRQEAWTIVADEIIKELGELR